MNKCKICKNNQVDLLTSIEEIKYKGEILNVQIEYSLCTLCNHEFISKEQILSNEKNIRNAKKLYDGLFTSNEITKARLQLKLTQEQASLVFGGGRNAFSKYERGIVSQSIAMDKLIKQALKFPIVFENLKNDAGIDNNKLKIECEDNIISYSDYKFENKNKLTKTRNKKMQEVNYG